MKPTYRRLRRRSANREALSFKKDNQQEHSFFGETMQEPFFKPVTAMSQNAGIQRKCDGCEKEEKKVQKKSDDMEKKDEEKKLQKKSDGMEKKEEEKKLQKKSDDKEKKEEDKKLQKKEAGAGNTSATAVSGYVNNLHGKGNSLSASAQHFFGQRMGYDFSHVKIHTGKDAADSAKAVHAKAYAVGSHIVFNEGQFNQESAEGKKLLAHELTHVIQQEKKEINHSLQRQPNESPEPASEEKLPFINLEVTGSKIQNTRHYADCNGVSVSGDTQANYRSSASLATQPTRATDCSGCSARNCVTVNSTVVSRFNTRPVVTLPNVPGNLNPCERRAVRAFINGTLSQHEQQHVAAFNTYRGTESTPISFTGCRADLQTEIQNIHDSVEVPRRQASDDLSALLDANGANIFNITCECPDRTTGGGTR